MKKRLMSYIYMRIRDIEKRRESTSFALKKRAMPPSSIGLLTLDAKKEEVATYESAIAFQSATSFKSRFGSKFISTILNFLNY